MSEAIGIPAYICAAKRLSRAKKAAGGDREDVRVMSRYRAFVGEWDNDNPDDPEWIKLDVRDLSFDDARVRLAEELRAFEGDSCDYCRAVANGELERLLSSKPGQFKGNVDGDDYMIIAEMD